MKKIALLACFFTLINFTLEAQSFRLGIQASPNFSWMSTNTNSIEGSGLKLGFDVGILGDYFFDIDERYAVSTGLSLVVGQGGNLTYSVGGNLFPDSNLSDSAFYNLPNGVEASISAQYIEIPISVKLRTGGDELVYFAQIPYFSFAFPIQGRADFTGTGVNTENENILSSINGLNLTWGLGGGVEYQQGNATFVGGLYFQNSIIDIIENRGTQLNTGVEEDAKQVINRLTIRLSVFF